MPRQDTRWESEGAEFLTLGNLLLQKIPTYKTYTNMPGYDLVATNPEMNTSAKIQVKSRWRTSASGFLINNFACDFVVIVKLNRGSQDGRVPPSSPEFYVIPVEVISQMPRSDGWGKISFSSIINFESYKNNWEQISKFLVNAAKWETILNIGCEGGGYKIEGTKNSDTWRFRLVSNSMWSGIHQYPITKKYDEAIGLLDSHNNNWQNLYPTEVHGEFTKLIFNDVITRDCHTDTIDQWKSLCQP